MSTLHLQVVGPERMLVDEQVSEVQIPALDGYVGVLPGHAAMLSALKAGGVLTYVAAGQTKKLAVYGGFAEVLATSARVLADGAEFGTEINKEKAQARLATAAKAADHITPDTDQQAAQHELLKAQAAVEAAA